MRPWPAAVWGDVAQGHIGMFVIVAYMTIEPPPVAPLQPLVVLRSVLRWAAIIGVYMSYFSTQPQRHVLSRGFTLVELMVTIAIMAILAALAVPSFKGLLERWRVWLAVESLQSMLYYARSEAIKRGGGIVLHKNAQGTDGCQEAGSDQKWGCGWFVFVDTNGVVA